MKESVVVLDYRKGVERMKKCTYEERLERVTYELLRRVLGKLEDELDEELDDLIGSVVDGYIDSEEFCEEACRYCRTVGWKEPE